MQPTANRSLRTTVETVPEPVADLFRRELRALTLVTRDDDSGGGHSGHPREPEPLPDLHEDSLP
jgi:hypothetical protein